MTKKYVIGFTGHFYVEAESQEEANEIAKSFSDPTNDNGHIRIDYVDWVI
jgi:hypothetical protein